MHDAASGRHPLHVAGSEPAAVAGGIRVLHLAVEDIGHGLEAAMWMVGRADCFAWRIVDRSHLVEQHERVRLTQARAGQRAARNEAGALALTMRGDELRYLERDGIVTRRIFPISPPQVEYRLTELGHSMSQPVLAFGEWVRVHLAEFDAARRRFDQRDGKAEQLSAP